MMEIEEGDVEAEKAADEVFKNLDNFARSEIVRGGTAFTTYEELGDHVCRCLERRCRAWYAATEPKR